MAVFRSCNLIAHKCREVISLSTPSDFIYIEDDLSDSIRAMPNPQKMFYNIDKCNSKLHEKHYDLVVRIRPDLGLENISRELDLWEIYEKSAKDFAIFVNNKYGRTYFFLRGCPACFLILKGVVISSHETNRFS